MSVMTTFRAPTCLQIATAMMPMGPAPVMSTSSPTRSKDRAVCVAFPRASMKLATSSVTLSWSSKTFWARKAEVFCEATGPIHADTGGRPAQVPPAGSAVAAHSTRDVTFASDAGTQLQDLHLGTELLDHTTVLVANDHRGRDGALRPVVPIVDVDVGAAYGRLLDLDQHVIRANRGLRHVHEGQALTAVLLHERLHACAPEDGLDGRRDAASCELHLLAKATATDRLPRSLDCTHARRIMVC
mmetsp:Transcript_32430/g.82304  ORF Transcript_32430/g.82304 Transcript_32430/m.82304 type:complete len:243 (+) Transcript_32430:422-1150(+)